MWKFVRNEEISIDVTIKNDKMIKVDDTYIICLCIFV